MSNNNNNMTLFAQYRDWMIVIECNWRLNMLKRTGWAKFWREWAFFGVEAFNTFAPITIIFGTIAVLLEVCAS